MCGRPFSSTTWGGHTLAGSGSSTAWSSSGAPHRGRGLLPSEPELVAGSHDRVEKLTPEWVCVKLADICGAFLPMAQRRKRVIAVEARRSCGKHLLPFAGSYSVIFLAGN